MADEDRAYTAWLRKQTCCGCGGARQSRVEVHHHTHRRALGQRAGDRDGMPLCRLCHHDFHASRGQFFSYTKAMKRAFQDAAVSSMQALYNGGGPLAAINGEELF